MADGAVIRKNVDTLSDVELVALRSAYGAMMQLGDNRGYNYWSGLHGVPGFYCWHGPRIISGRPFDLFLPWHRAYILLFEQAAKDQNASAVLPWWDWTSSQSHSTGAPTAFTEQTLNGQPNPLYKSHIDVPNAQPPLDRDTLRFPGDPNDLPSADDVTSLFGLNQFEDFSNQLQDIHNRIHGWTGGIATVSGSQVGGDMGVVATAAFDPIFWSHHCMIDRIWYLWQIQNGVNNIPPDYLTEVLAPFNLTVQDVLNIGLLGYEYAVSSTSVSS